MARKGRAKAAWDARKVRSLRRYLGSTQREMADLLRLPACVITVGAYRQQGLIHIYRGLLRQGVSSEGRSPLLKERRSLYYTAGAPRALPFLWSAPGERRILVSWRLRRRA